jgi:hypothetical protein
MLPRAKAVDLCSFNFLLMKTWLTLFIAGTGFFPSFAQIRSFPDAVQTVLLDFPNNLRHITGELMLAQGESEDYASLVALPGAEHCVITRYHSVHDTTVSWQARMFSTDDFEKAYREYRELFVKLQACYLQLADGSIVILKGECEPAKEEASFTTSTLRLVTGDGRYKEVKVELELAYLLADWGVRINIFSKAL